jgi:hypothetical protein
MSEQEVVVVFRTKAELDGAKSAIASMERAKGASMALGQDTSKVSADLAAAQARMASAKFELPKAQPLKELREALGETVPGFAKLDAIVGKLGTGSLGMAAAGAGLLAAALKGCSAAISEFRVAETATVKLDAALAQSSQLTDAYRERLQGLAEALEDMTGKDSLEWMDALTRLTQFGANAGNIDQASDAVKNLAGILGGDLSAAAMLVARALQGNYEQFGRYGIRVDEAATATEKWNKMCQEVARRGGGQLEAQTQTLTGRINVFKDSIGDLLRSVGTWISKTGILQTALDGLSNVFQSLNWWIATTIPRLRGLHNVQQDTTGSANAAAEAEERQANAIRNVRENAERARRELDLLTESIRRRQRLQDAEDDAQMAVELEQMDAAEASGQVSRPEAAANRAGIQRFYADQRYRRAQAASVAEIAGNEAANQDDLNGVAQRRREIAQSEAVVRELAGRQAVQQHREAIVRIRNEQAELRRNARGYTGGVSVEDQIAGLDMDVERHRRKIPGGAAGAFTRADSDRLRDERDRLAARRAAFGAENAPGNYADQADTRIRDRNTRIAAMGEESASRTRVWMYQGQADRTRQGTADTTERNRVEGEIVRGQHGIRQMDQVIVRHFQEYHGNVQAMLEHLVRTIGLSHEETRRVGNRVMQLEQRVTASGR